MKTNLFVTGPFSRIGSRIVETASKRGMSVIGLESIRQKQRHVDVTDESALFAFFRQHQPNLVVNTAAMTDVDVCERDKDAAHKINVNGAELLARASAEFGAKLVHLSTDYVFDGKNGPYFETDRPNPINVYGSTKLRAEELVLKHRPNALITRICVPYDWNANARSNFLMWAVDKLKKGEKIKGLTDQWSTPSCVPHIVQTILDLGLSSHEGIVHLSDRDFLSRFDFLKIMAEIFGLNGDLIAPGLTSELSQAAKRPVRGGLKTDKAEKWGFRMLSVRDGLSLVKKLL